MNLDKMIPILNNFVLEFLMIILMFIATVVIIGVISFAISCIVSMIEWNVLLNDNKKK
jgi:hypothetical protein